MRNKLKLSLLIPLGIILIYISSGKPELVEKFYSGGIYRPIGIVLSKAAGVLPFSIAEPTVILVPAAFIIYTARVLVKTISRRGADVTPLLKYSANILVIISIVFFSFIGLWGMNYYRMPFASIAGLEIQPASVKDLGNLCNALIERANTLRSSVGVDPKGNVDIPGSTRDILKNCYKGYEAIADMYPELAGSYGDPKPVLLSRLMSYTGICGVYFPFTGEANVNVSIPESTLPSTASHEMAHQRGFSREDEANYISYLACTAHPDANYKYSGILLALTNSMNALYKNDQELFKKLSENYSEGVRHDLKEINEYWARYEGPVERTSDKINDTYLKANNQKDGVKSYGRMVDLLIAEYRQKNSLEE
jgi:hypothetical protein